MTLPLLLLALTGCSPGPLIAPFESSVGVPEDVEFSYDQGYVNPGDGVGGLFFGRANVTGPDGLPLNGVKVEVMSGWTGAYLIPEGAVTIIDDYEEACVGTGADDPCHAYFDVEGQTYVEFAGDFEDIGDFRPTYMSGATDEHGNLPIYVFVDSIPITSDGEGAPIPIYVDILVDFAFYTLTAQI